MAFEESLKKGVLFGFIPHNLEIAGRPELSVFPFNVMFAQYGTKEGKNVMGSAVYEPDWATFKREGTESSMTYRNSYGGDGYLVITHDGKSYHGEKYVGGKSAGSADGGLDWKMFFVHFTALGLANGERCKFEDMPN
ncbi:MAG: hypothetical protein Q7S09_02605 [bacterium]|nr:hypothetical protein [bacterium]